MKKNIFMSVFIFLVSSLAQSSNHLINVVDRCNILDTAFYEERNFMLQQGIIIPNIENQIVSNQSDTSNILDTAYSEEPNFMLRPNVISNNIVDQIVPNQSNRAVSSRLRLEELRQRAVRREELRQQARRIEDSSTTLVPSFREQVLRRRNPEQSIGTLALSSHYY